jgi:hypothetical protein
MMLVVPLDEQGCSQQEIAQFDQPQQRLADRLPCLLGLEPGLSLKLALPLTFLIDEGRQACFGAIRIILLQNPPTPADRSHVAARIPALQPGHCPYLKNESPLLTAAGIGQSSSDSLLLLALRVFARVSSDSSLSQVTPPFFLLGRGDGGQ